MKAGSTRRNFSMVVSPCGLSPCMWWPTFGHLQGKAGRSWNPHRRNSSPGCEALMLNGSQAMDRHSEPLPALTSLSADSRFKVVSLAWVQIWGAGLLWRWWYEATLRIMGLVWVDFWKTLGPLSPTSVLLRTWIRGECLSAGSRNCEMKTIFLVPYTRWITLRMFSKSIPDIKNIMDR